MELLRVLLIPLAVLCVALAVLTRWSFGFALAAAIMSGVAVLWLLIDSANGSL